MLLNPIIKSKKLGSVLIILSGFLYLVFAYELERTQVWMLLGLYTALFVLFWQLMSLNNFKLLVGVGIAFRLLLIAVIPNLSQDFYRFIWDGRMILEGFNPYLYTPESFLINNELPINQAQELYEGMGALNASHFTNYPPINQLCFIIAGLFSGSSILGAAIVLRSSIILADIGILYFGGKLLSALKLPKQRILWYFLNPFIIIELTGNLHFEAVMLFFLIWSLYLLQQGKWQWAGVIFALSISTKLIPLLFLPLFLKWFLNSSAIAKFSKGTEALESSSTLSKNNGVALFAGLKKLSAFYFIVIGVSLLTFLPFFSSEFISNYSATVALWFNNFEFNASIYYLAREIGYLFRGYNEIAVIGKVLSMLVLLFVLAMAFFRNNTSLPKLITTMLLSMTFYLLFSTTVHPWYISTLVLLSIFTNYRFPLVWSFVIILSYLAYININSADKSENLLVIAIEYMSVFTVIIWEFIKQKKERSHAPLID